MATPEKTPEQIAEDDRKADMIAVLVIFTALILGVIHFASGWTPLVN